MNYKKAIEVLEELKPIYPKLDDELDLTIKTMRNIKKAMRYNGVIE